MAMIAFHGQQEIKDFYVNRVRQHRLADEICHGFYWEGGKGCAVGCTLHSAAHQAYEEELGIPTIVASLEDGIFEGLSAPEDTAWPEDVLRAIPVGADLSGVWPQFAVALLGDEHHGVLRHVQASRYIRQRDAVEAIIALYEKWVMTGIKPATSAAASAASAAAAATSAATSAASADAAAAYAAYAASDAAAAYATSAASAAAAAYATSAASAATAAYAAAATSADAAAAYAAAKKQARQWQAVTFLDLLRAAPQPRIP